MAHTKVVVATICFKVIGNRGRSRFVRPGSVPKAARECVLRVESQTGAEATRKRHLQRVVSITSAAGLVINFSKRVQHTVTGDDREFANSLDPGHSSRCRIHEIDYTNSGR